MKRSSTIIETIDYPIAAVWKIVTDNRYYKWRSDLKKIEIIDSTNFIETDKHGYATSFVITKSLPYTEYQFSMSNANFKGLWIGYFNKIDETKTEVTFTEIMSVKNPFVWFASLFVFNIKKIQRQYIADLRKELEKNDV